MAVTNLGIIYYSEIIFWVLENAELASAALSAGSAMAAQVGAGAVGALELDVQLVQLKLLHYCCNCCCSGWRIECRKWNSRRWPNSS